MNLLWRNGYQASSLSDLLDEMKIGLGSFYAAFGDKRRLYLECLNLFQKSRIDRCIFCNAMWRKALTPVLMAILYLGRNMGGTQRL